MVTPSHSPVASISISDSLSSTVSSNEIRTSAGEIFLATSRFNGYSPPPAEPKTKELTDEVNTVTTSTYP